MNGAILNFDISAGTGVLRADDGKRYSFSTSDWSSSGVAQAGDTVDFEPSGAAATEIFLIKRAATIGNTAAAMAGLAGQMGQRLSNGEGNASLTENPLLTTIKARPAMIAAVMIGLSSFLPFVSAPPIPFVNFDGGGINLYSIVSYIWSAVSGLGMFAPASLTAPLRLIVLLLAIPGCAFYLAYREYTGGASDRLRFRTGLLALIGPLGIPLLTVLLAVLFSGGGIYVESLFNGLKQGGGTVSNFFGYGMFGMMLGGVTLIGLGKGGDPIKHVAGAVAFFLFVALVMSVDDGSGSAARLPATAVALGVLIWLLRTQRLQTALLYFAGFGVAMRVISFLGGGSFGLYGNASMFLGLAGAGALLFAITKGGWNPLAHREISAETAAPSRNPDTLSQKFCPDCGTANSASDQFCADCGKGL